MMEVESVSPCSDDELSSVLEALRADNENGLVRLAKLILDFPADPRLHFLNGSMMAARHDYDGARASMRRAVDLAPDFLIARFQLGFLHLTCGEPYRAQEVWGPLHGLPSGHFLRHLVQGLCHLIRDEFDEAVRELEMGIGANEENMPLNADMKLIIAEVGRREMDMGEALPSSTQSLLQQAALKATRH